nr:histidine kinase [Auraticoccus cholistanensis]
MAERTRLDERHRIAGEMHDVVGHALTVTLLHLGSARLSLDDDLDRVRSSLAEAERAARASLDDVRAAVALLRAPAPPGAASAPPTPTAADITGLVESFRRTGTPVEVQVRGDLAALGANRGLAAYRIVQESLTNAARHGDGSPITVRLDTAADRTTITVRSGAAAPSPQPAGTGLTAMRERAEALGGQLVAGPATGGWRVEAVLPA